MIRPEIFEKAADIIKDKRQQFTCVAVKHAVVILDNINWPENIY